MNKPFSEQPIVRGTNPNTGLLEGDDSGYRKVPVSGLDNENPDPMVLVTEVATLPLYAQGAVKGLCVYYPEGLGGPDKVLVRAPVAKGLAQADVLLKPYGRKLLVVDGWRPWWVQAALWAYLRTEIIKAEGLTDGQLSIYDEVRLGCKADDVGSYCAVLENDEFQAAKAGFVSEKDEEICEAAVKLGKSPDEVATLFLTFEANLKRNKLRVQEDAVTAHGNGGAVDVWTTDKDGRFSNLGVPFDYVPPPNTDISPAVINYFEMVQPDHYQAMVGRDPTLQKYLTELGVPINNGDVMRDTFYRAQRERRILFHTMMALGGTYFSLDKDLGEPWHFQLGNERGGNQAQVSGLEGSGNGCHAILKGIKSAVWSNAVGHKLAKQILG